MPSGIPPGAFRRTGLPALLSLSAAGGTSGGAGTIGARYDFNNAFSNWALRVAFTGASTEASVQLVGAVASSSDLSATLVPLTTWTLTVNTSESTIWITGKPVTSVAAKISSQSSSGTFNAWISGTP